MKQILYSVARTESGERIHATDAEKGWKYFCGYCKDPLVLKKSGNSGRGSKRPHFAHKSLTPNCSPESALHFEFKSMLVDEIGRRIDEQRDFPISWTCAYCRCEHSGNLIKKAHRVLPEHSIGNCRPDLALLAGDGRVLAVIEVVVTHAPEETAKEFYRKNGIAVVEIHLDSDDVLTNVKAKAAHADRVDLCPDRKRCDQCGHFREPIEMKLIEARCYACNARMKVPYIEGDHRRGSHIGPDQFTQEEIAIARKQGAIIKWQYSRTVNAKYWATTCGRCQKFIGRNFLFTEYIAPAASESLKIASIRLGDFCTYCERW